MPFLIEPVVAASALRTTTQPVIPVPAAGAVLRPWREADAAQVRAALSDEQIRRWNLHGVGSLGAARNWVEQWTGRWRRGTGASWAVADARRQDVVLGQVAFRSLYLADGLAELSCWVVPGARRRHLGTEATRALAAWALDTLGLERLEIVHSVRNPASCPVALRAGFRIEGVKRHLQRHEDGFHDMCLHARINGDDDRSLLPESPAADAPQAPAAAADELAQRRRRRLPSLRRSAAAKLISLAAAAMS